MKKRNIKLIFSFLTFAIILSVTSYLVNYTHSFNNIKKQLLENLSSETFKKQLMLNDFLEHTEKTLISIRQSNIFNLYLQKKVDIKIIEDFFLAFSRNHDSFMQLRYIDNKGLEVIRIDKDKKGTLPYIVKTESLQNKGNRYYFKILLVKLQR